MSNLIGLVGNAGVGKDACAALLKMVGYTRFAFADAVRREVEESFENNASIPHMPDHIFAHWLECAGEEDGILWKKPMTPSARQLLQWVGSEYRRAQDENYWIKKLETAILEYSSFIFESTVTFKNIVISDIRFKNEALWLRKFGGQVWRVNRPGCKPDGHVSETELLGIEADFVIENDGDLQHLATQVLRGLHLAKA